MKTIHGTKVPTTTEVLTARTLMVREWFTNHRAQRWQLSTEPYIVEALKWARPDTRNYRIDYLCDGPHLIVTGDLGDAIYEAGGRGLDWWGACDLGYFAGKCVASESGRGYEEWDADYARASIEDHFEDPGVRARFDSERGADALHRKDEWLEWLRDSADEVFGPNWHDLELWDAGQVTSMRCEGHLLGLKAALRQLTPNAAGEGSTP